MFAAVPSMRSADVAMAFVVVSHGSMRFTCGVKSEQQNLWQVNTFTPRPQILATWSHVACVLWGRFFEQQ
jgi:hypothetical protein